jgi:hypothetical protein
MKKVLIWILIISIVLLVKNSDIIYCIGDNSTGGSNNLNLNLNFNDVFKYGSMSATAVALIKACPPQTRPGVALAISGLGAGIYAVDSYFKNKNGGGSQRDTSAINIVIDKGNSTSSTNNNNMVIDEILKLKERFIGVVNCEGSNEIELVTNSSIEIQFFYGLTLLLIIAIYTNIGIILNILVRYIYNKPLNNKYLEKIRKVLYTNNNIMLMTLFILQLISISYALYGVCKYVQLNF